MIKDNIKNINRYSINDHFEQFKKIILSLEPAPNKLQLPLKAIPLEYETKNFDLSKFEIHKAYIDIHLIIEGQECIGLNDLNELFSVSEYNIENDFQLYEGEIKDKLILNPGEFILLYPGEAHVTGGKIFETGSVKKIVYKILF